MSTTLRKRGLVMTVMAGCLGMTLFVEAQQKEKDTDEVDKEAESTATLVQELGTAAQLSAFGRGELSDLTGLKDFKSPEALVAAGSIYLRAHKATGGKLKPLEAKIVDGDGNAVAEDTKAPSLAEEAEALFDEARAMATTNGAAIEALIKQAKSVESRGAVGGPQVINRTIKSGKTHNIDIAFNPRMPASVSIRASGRIQFEVLGNRGKVLWHNMGTWGFYNWQPGNGGLSNVTVRVINAGGPQVSYTVTTN